MLDKLRFKVDGHLNVSDKQTGEVLEDKDNAIHPQHFALIFARALANENYFNIHSMVLGNGGSYIDTAGNIIYNAPNTTGNNASLYNQTWTEVVDGSIANTNTVIAVPSNTDLTSSVIVTATLTSGEPNSQFLSDTADINNPANQQIPETTGGEQFNFDELGLVVKNPLYIVGGTAPEYLLLSHLVFNPIQKNANRELLLTYTLTISVS